MSDDSELRLESVIVEPYAWTCIEGNRPVTEVAMGNDRVALAAQVAIFGLLMGASGCGDATFLSSDGRAAPVVVEEPAGDSNPESTGESERPIRERLSGHLGLDRGVTEEARPKAGAEAEAPQGFRAPLEVLAAYRERPEGERSIAVARNIIAKTVPHAMYVYVHDGGGTTTSFEQLKPGEVKEFMPAPKEDPERFIEHRSGVLVEKLVDAGVERERASGLVAEKADALFRRHGRRVIYVAPDTWTRATGNEPLGAVEASLPSQ